MLFPEASHRRAGAGELGAVEGRDRQQCLLSGGRGCARAAGTGAVQCAGIPPLGLACRAAGHGRSRGVRSGSGPGCAICRSQTGRYRYPQAAGAAGAGIVSARVRWQGPARGGALESGLRLGADQALCQRLCRRVGAIRAGPLCGHGNQALPQQTHLCRLPAQRAWSHRSGVVLAARPPGRTGGIAAAVVRFGQAASRQCLHPARCPRQVASPPQGPWADIASIQQNLARWADQG